MTEQLTKNLLIRLIKEEINKALPKDGALLEQDEIPAAVINTPAGPYSPRPGGSRREDGALIRGYKKDREAILRKVRAERAKWEEYAEAAGSPVAFEDTALGKQRKKELDQINRAIEITRGWAEEERRASDASYAKIADERMAQFAKAKKKKSGSRRSGGRGGRGVQPRFMSGFEQYRIPFESEFGGLEKEDFDAFYDEMGLPNTRRARDYRFGRKHAELFDQFLEKRKEEEARAAAQYQAQAKAKPTGQKPSQDKINAAIRFVVNSIISTNDLGQQLSWVDKGVNSIEKLHGRKLTPEERKGFRDDVIYNVSMMKQKAATA